MPKPDKEEELKQEIEHLKTIIGTMIVWIASSANSPISRQEAGKLVEMLEEKKNAT
jgi:hypothetical protein